MSTWEREIVIGDERVMFDVWQYGWTAISEAVLLESGFAKRASCTPDGSNDGLGGYRGEINDTYFTYEYGARVSVARWAFIYNAGLDEARAALTPRSENHEG